jgi:hypothetical protein
MVGLGIGKPARLESERFNRLGDSTSSPTADFYRSFMLLALSDQAANVIIATASIAAMCFIAWLIYRNE